jgi:hypothetical protein
MWWVGRLSTGFPAIFLMFSVFMVYLLIFHGFTFSYFFLVLHVFIFYFIFKLKNMNIFKPENFLNLEEFSNQNIFQIQIV